MISQVGIVIFGLTAVFLSQQTELRLQRWAPVVGLVGQPFWFVATVSAEQWGMFLVVVLYTIVWAIGLRNHWFRRNP